MKKRLISLALSAITAISAVTAMNTNALHWWGSIDEAVIEETFKDYKKLDVAKYECLNYVDAEYLYMEEKENFDAWIRVIEVEKHDDLLYVEVSSDVNINELKEQVQAFDEDFEISIYQTAKGSDYLQIKKKMILPETIKKIREFVGDKAIGFQYNGAIYRYNFVNIDYITGYNIYRVVDTIEKDGRTEYITESNEEILMEYAENHSDEVEFKIYGGDKDFRGVEMWHNSYYLIPKKELTTMEHLDLAQDIYEETGLNPFGYEYHSADLSGSVNGITLDLINYLNGDANCDGVQSMADAASIFQAIGNPDKYSLSDLGQFNADYAGDGLTPDDAIAIQKKLAGIAE